jgi:hypothetical protein
MRDTVFACRFIKNHCSGNNFQKNKMESVSSPFFIFLTTNSAV